MRSLNNPTNFLSIDQITHSTQPAHQSTSFITPKKMWLHLRLWFDCHLSQPFKSTYFIDPLLPALINRPWGFWDLGDLVHCPSPSLKLALPIMWLPRMNRRNSRNIGWMYLGLDGGVPSCCSISSNWWSMAWTIPCMMTSVYLWNLGPRVGWMWMIGWLTSISMQIPSGTNPTL